MSIPIIDQLRPLGNFPAVDASDVQAGNQRLSTVLSNTPSTAYVDNVVENKVDKVEGKGLSTNDFTNAYKSKLDGLDSALAAKANSSDVTSGLAGKVDKKTGKGLSTNDYTTAEKDKLAGIEAQANKTIISTSVPAIPTDGTVPSMKLVDDNYAPINDVEFVKTIEFVNNEDITDKFLSVYEEVRPFSKIIIKGNGKAYISAIMFGTPNSSEPNKNNRPLLADKHLSIVGLGDVTLSLKDDSNSDFFVFCDCEGWNFSGIIFDFNLSNQSFDVDYSNWDGYSATFLCFRCKDFTFTRCKFINSRSFEINFSKDCSGLILDRCDFTSNDISLDAIAQKIQITNCTFASTTRAIYFEGMSEETTVGHGWNRYVSIENSKFSIKIIGLCDYVSIFNCDISKIEIEVRDYKCFTVSGSTINNAIVGGNIKVDNSKVGFTAIYSRVNPTIVSSSEVSLNLTINSFDKLIFNNCTISTDSNTINFTAATRDQDVIFNCCDLQNKRIIFNDNARQRLQLNGCYNVNQNNNVIYPRTLIPMVSVLPTASLEYLYTMCILNTGLESTLYYCGYDNNTNPSWIPIAKAS